jgi:outer membrane receptor protein involved in Fe transport
VLYGTDALGGVVHIVTRTPTPRAAPFFEVRSTIKGAQGVPERSARVEFEGGVGPLAVLGGVSVKAFGDLRAGGDLGVRAPSGYDEADADLKVRWNASVRQALTLTVQRVRQEDVGRFDQVAQRGFASWAFDPQERWLGALAYTYDVRAAGVDRISVTAAAQRTREDRRSRRIGSLVEVVERDVVRVGSGSLDLAWRPLAGWRVVSGVDLTREQVDSGRVDTDARTGIGVPRRGLYADDAEAGSAAAFTQAQREFGRVHVESGVRYASYTVRSSAPTFGAFTMASSALVAQGGVSIAASAALHPYASVWQGFRAPNIDDVSALGSFDFGVEVPTRTLRPESSLGAEGGAKWRARRWSGAVALYRMGLRDLIERSRGTWLGEPTYEGQAVYVRENVGRAFVRGVEVESSPHRCPWRRGSPRPTGSTRPATSPCAASRPCTGCSACAGSPQRHVAGWRCAGVAPRGRTAWRLAIATTIASRATARPPGTRWPCAPDGAPRPSSSCWRRSRTVSISPIESTDPGSTAPGARPGSAHTYECSNVCHRADAAFATMSRVPPRCPGPSLMLANPSSTAAATTFGNAGRITPTIGGLHTMQRTARLTF